MLRADLHIHTVLSPCGDVEMSPVGIIGRAKEQGIKIVGITDHNSTRQCEVVREVGKRLGVYVLCGAEITTQEEVHVLVFAEYGEALEKLQEFLDDNLPERLNNPQFFGHQLVVDQEENVTYQEERLLISALGKTLEEVREFCDSINGIFIPAHIDKARDSIISQLGFVPPDLVVDALEVTPHCDLDGFMKKHPYLTKHNLISSSDAHYVEEIGRATTTLELDYNSLTFQSIKRAINDATLL